MKYALIDKREGFQIAYIGTTNSLEERSDGHKADFRKSIQKKINTFSLLSTTNHGMNNNLSRKERWFKEMHFFNQSYEMIVIDKNDKYSESAWLNAFDKYFYMTNHQGDVTKAREHQPIGFDYKYFPVIKQVSENDFNTALENIRKKITLNLKEKISINEYQIRWRIQKEETSFKYDLKTYFPSNLTDSEKNNFKKEYLIIHQEIEKENNQSPHVVILDFKLYQLDTPAKIAIVRDYFNNDLYYPFLYNQDNLFFDEDMDYFVENMETLFQNNIFPRKENLNDIRYTIETINTGKVKFLKDWVTKKEILG